MEPFQSGPRVPQLIECEPKMSTDNTVFVIDDDGRLSIIARRSAGQTAGFTTATYGSGRAFLEVAPRLTSGCILLDVRMPEMDGLEVLQELNKLGTRLPVILMSGYADTAIAVQAMKAGGVDLSKSRWTLDGS